VALPVDWNARLIGAHPTALNALFASIQLLLGLGFLFRRTARVAIVSSVAWAAGVWYLGEGLGGVAGGHVTALLGAPGAAFIYALLAVAAWPKSKSCGLSGSIDSQRPPHWTLIAWALLWIGFALLSALPANASVHAISSQLTSNASTVPSWLGSVDRGLASFVHRSGTGFAVGTVIAELAIAVLALGRGKLRTVSLWTGIVLAGIYWASGQSFGQLFSGQATDPSTGPLLIVLGLAALGVTRTTAAPATQTISRGDGSVSRPLAA
jgi:hypothetical protein